MADTRGLERSDLSATKGFADPAAGAEPSPAAAQAGKRAGDRAVLRLESTPPAVQVGGEAADELKELLSALESLERGDFSTRLAWVSEEPVLVRIAEAFNGLASQNERLALELSRFSASVGREGVTTDRAVVAGATGGYASVLESVNALVSDLLRPVEPKNRSAPTSKHTSKFLASMSHELRTPLNSLLILARQLSSNADGNLTPRQVEFAETIHASGTELLNLINDLLDLSKAEAGKLEVHAGEIALEDVLARARRTFRPVAEQKQLDFRLDMDAHAPRFIFTDAQRLQQVLNNLLANAFKFTDNGGVKLRIRPAAKRRFPGSPGGTARGGLAFEVHDTGIGIPRGKRRLIFEAFQQADGTTSRKYGGTGLGLSISRQIAWLLGGEIGVRSQPGEGSVFTLYLPLRYAPGFTSAGAGRKRLRAPVPSQSRAAPFADEPARED